MVLVEKDTNKKKWETEWRQVVKQGSKVLDDPNEAKKIDDYTKGGEEVDALKKAWETKEKNLKKEKDSLVEVQDAIRSEKTSFDDTTNGKGSWEPTFTNFKDNWQTGGWKKKVNAHYPDTYTDNLYAVDLDSQSFKITEDQATKILARVIYEIGRLDKNDLTTNWDLGASSDPTATVAGGIFDRIKRCSDEIELIRSKGTSEDKVVNEDGKEVTVEWKDRKNKVWDLPFTYSEPQKVHSSKFPAGKGKSTLPVVAGDADKAEGKNEKPIIQSRYNDGNSLSRNDLAKTIYEFITKVLKDETIDKLNQKDVSKTATDFNIYQAGDAYDNDDLEAYGIEVADKEATTLYRSNIKFNETTKTWEPTAKISINVQSGLKDWIKLFKSVFSGEEVYKKFDEGLKASDPNYLLFQDLRNQRGVNDPFTTTGVAGTNYRLPESLEGLKDWEKDLLLSQSERIQRVKKLQDEADEDKRKVTKKDAEVKKLRAGIQDIADKVLKKKKEVLKTYELEKGFTDDNKRDWITLKKIQKLILEIRFLRNGGDATKACDYEKDATNHCTGLVGEIDPTGSKKGYKDKDGKVTQFDVTTKGTLDALLVSAEGSDTELTDRFYLFTYFRQLSQNGTKTDIEHAISKIKNGEDDLLDGMETKEKFALYKKHFEFVEANSTEKFNDWEEKAKKAIEKEAGEDTGETAKDWREKLKTIDASLDDSSLITEAWKNQWTAMDKFNTGDKVKALFEKIKDKKDDFVTKLPELSGETSLNSLKLMAAKKPKEIIAYIERYCYDKLDDSSSEEKDKKKTQMKRRLAKKLNKTKESEITDEQITETLVKIQTGELDPVDMTKFYTADLKEITPKKGPGPGDKKKSKWYEWGSTTGKVLIIGSGTLLVLGLLTVIFWDSVKNKWNEWFGGEDENEIIE